MLAQTTSSSITNVCAVRRERVGQRDEPRQHGGHADAGESRPPLEGHRHRDVHAAVGEDRQRPPRLERERRQHRRDLAREHAGQVRRDVRAPGRAVEQANPRRVERGAQVRPDIELVAQHPPCARLHGGQLLLGVVAVGRHLVGAGVQLLERRRHPDHEELVEVRRRDGEELHAFEQRVGGVAGLIEHALVELEPAQLTVDVQRRIAQVGRRHVSRWNGDERSGRRTPGAATRRAVLGTGECGGEGSAGRHDWGSMLDGARRMPARWRLASR